MGKYNLCVFLFDRSFNNLKNKKKLQDAEKFTHDHCKWKEHLGGILIQLEGYEGGEMWYMFS